MNFVIISAALSGMNTNVYLCSRMLFLPVARPLCAATFWGGSATPARR